MILVTGGTGFIGQALVRRLVTAGLPVRILLRPSHHSPTLPRGVAVDAAVCSLSDERSLRAAMMGVDTVIHLAGAERKGSRSDLKGVDVTGSRTVARVARQANIHRILFLSHLGSDRSSAYPVLKAKALSEHAFLESGVGCTIVRSGPVFGPGDQFTTSLSQLLKIAPGIFFLPGDGHNLIQPIWIDDLVACLFMILEEQLPSRTKIIEVGGSEYLSFRDTLQMIMTAAGFRRQLVQLSPAYIRMISLWLEQTFPRFPVSIFWLDYLSSDRTCGVDVLPRQFGIIPARFQQNLSYLHPTRKNKELSLSRRK